ncbi:MAG: transglutaminase family protein [Hyphomicrobiaceae bacterium]
MLISIRHRTRYTYDAPAKYAIQALRLTPPSFTGQTVKNWSVKAPCIEQAVHFTDSFGNAASLVACNLPHTEIEIVAEGLVETKDCAGIVKGLIDPSPNRIYLRQTPATTPDAAIRELAAKTKAETILARLHALTEAIRERVEYEPGSTSQLTPAAEVLAQGKGVCQDHAHVFITAARSLGIPARYVNGYFLSGAEGPEAAHHAWAEAYVNHLGWVGFDVANLVCPDERFVRLATGLDSASASPIRGSRPIPSGTSSVKETLDVHVEVIDVSQTQSQSQSSTGQQQQQQPQAAPTATPKETPAA